MNSKQRADKYFDNAAERIAFQGDVGAGETAIDRDTLNEYVRTTTGWAHTGTAGADHAHIATSALVEPAKDAVFYNFTLDAQAVPTGATEYIIYNTSGFNGMAMKLGASDATNRISVQFDMSSDQSGDWSAKMGFASSAANPGAGTAAADMTHNATWHRNQIIASAIRVYVSTVGTTAAAPISVALKGAV